MSNRDPFEEMLAGLSRPVQPRPVFTRALGKRLMATFDKSIQKDEDHNEMEPATAATRSWQVSDDGESSRRRWVPVLEIAAVVLIAIGIGAGVLASRGMLPGQSNDNHAALTTEYPITPDPSECTVEPRTVEEVEALMPDFSQGFPGEQEPQATPPITLRHHAASEEVTKEIEAAYREWFACQNAGDLLRITAFYTDDLLRAGSVSWDGSDENLAPLPPDKRFTILDITYVREFEDGRAGAVVIVNTQEAPAAITPIFFIFEKHGDRWLIDGIPMWWSSTIEDSDSDEVSGSDEVPLPTATAVLATTVELSPTVVPGPTVMPSETP